MWAAIFVALSTILFMARMIASPPTANERDPYVPMPNGILAVSPCTISTFSMGMPSCSVTSCANVVSWPWPWLWEPVNTVTEPVGWTRTSADS